jgi:hypothetical protein
VACGQCRQIDARHFDIIFEISISYEMKYLNYNLTFIKHLKIHAQLKIYKWLNHDFDEE